MCEARVLSAIAEDEVVKLAQELVRIPSENPPGNEKNVAEFLASHLEAMGLDVHIIEIDVRPGRPNVVAILRGAAEGPTLLLNGHLDVVPAGDGWNVDPYGGVIANGRLYGRGAADMKGPLAAMVGALAAIERGHVSLRGTAVLAAVADEEVNQAGTWRLAKDQVKADFAIVGEPTSLKPVIAHKGDVYFDIVTRGKAAHGSTPHLGVNAIVKMLSVAKELERLSQELRKKRHYLVGHPTLSVGKIQGGLATNVVPDRCTMSVDRRLIPGETADEAEQELREVLNRIKSSDPEFEADLAMPVISLPMQTSQTALVVKTVRAATEEVLGKDPGVHGWSAACDASILVNAMKIPTVVFGPGDLAAQAHKANECIEIEELLQGARIFALTIQDLLS